MCDAIRNASVQEIFTGLNLRNFGLRMGKKSMSERRLLKLRLHNSHKPHQVAALHDQDDLLLKMLSD